MDNMNLQMMNQNYSYPKVAIGKAYHVCFRTDTDFVKLMVFGQDSNEVKMIIIIITFISSCSSWHLTITIFNFSIENK